MPVFCIKPTILKLQKSPKVWYSCFTWHDSWGNQGSAHHLSPWGKGGSLWWRIVVKKRGGWGLGAGEIGCVTIKFIRSPLRLCRILMILLIGSQLCIVPRLCSVSDDWSFLRTPWKPFVPPSSTTPPPPPLNGPSIMTSPRVWFFFLS